MTETKRLHAAAVQDLSGFGRCSLTVALPVLSAMGVQVSCLPTAVLSTHTGGFQGYTFRDLTEDMEPFFRHWQREGLRFDALYAGYLGSVRQAELVEKMIAAFRTENTLVLIDPVMGDHGKLYSRFDGEMVRGIRALCGQADVIVPNMTEAAFLTGLPYRESGHDEACLRELGRALLRLGPKKAVLTGVSPSEERLGAACFEGDEMTVYTAARVPAAYDGTGDLFASVLLGALLHGQTALQAAKLAADFTGECVAQSLKNGVDPHFGVDFEPLLWRLGQTVLDGENA